MLNHSIRKVKFYLFLIFTVPIVFAADELTFAGYGWITRNGNGQPGPNNFSSSRVRVENDSLIMSMSKDKVVGWLCSEIISTSYFHFGEFIFELEALPTFDKKLVFGIFTFPDKSDEDGTNEIDIEFSHWGSLAIPRGNFGLFRKDKDLRGKPVRFRFDVPEMTERVVVKILWLPHSIKYSVKSPHINVEWVYSPQNYKDSIPNLPQRLHLNYWKMSGDILMSPPDVKVTSFKYFPLDKD